MSQSEKCISQSTGRNCLMGSSKVKKVNLRHCSRFALSVLLLREGLIEQSSLAKGSAGQKF